MHFSPSYLLSAIVKCFEPPVQGKGRLTNSLYHDYYVLGSGSLPVSLQTPHELTFPQQVASILVAAVITFSDVLRTKATADVLTLLLLPQRWLF